MKLIPDWLIYLSIVVALVIYANRDKETVIVPAPPPVLGEMLPSESPRDDRIIVEVSAPQSGVGTAFAVDHDGTWITARHVVDSCDQVGLMISPRRLMRIDDTRISESADLAVLRGDWEREPLHPDLLSARQIGELGYFFGFPQGEPGEVVGTLMARGLMQVRGRYRSDEPVLIWSEVARTRGLLGSLGGISGAPALDQDGEVIGVVSAETPRRGRIYTVAPRTLRTVFPNITGTATALDRERYPLHADQLRRDRRVAQVVCINQ